MEKLDVLNNLPLDRRAHSVIKDLKISPVKTCPLINSEVTQMMKMQFQKPSPQNEIHLSTEGLVNPITPFEVLKALGQMPNKAPGSNGVCFGVS